MQEEETQDASTSAEQEETETSTETETEEAEQDAEADKAREELEKERKARKDTELRAKKAEEELKKLKSAQKETSTEGLSTNDLIHISRAQLHEDDVERVTKWMKDNGMSAKEALADWDLKAILANRAEMRKSQDAAATGAARRSPAKPVAEKVIADTFRNDKIPEPGSAEAEALYRARVAQRRGG